MLTVLQQLVDSWKHVHFARRSSLLQVIYAVTYAGLTVLPQLTTVERQQLRNSVPSVVRASLQKQLYYDTDSEFTAAMYIPIKSWPTSFTNALLALSFFP
jgi:hypothetical protein